MSDAEGLAQDVVVRCWQTFHSFNPQRGNFRAWIATLTNNYLNTCHRSAKRQTIADQEPEDRPLDNLDVAFIDDDQSERDLSHLPKQMYQIAAMLGMGYTRQEVAETIGCSIQTLERLVAQHKSTLEAA